MIQKLIEKLNKKRLKERISSAIVMVALIVSISGVVGAVSGIIVSNRYNYALKNYGFSQGDIGKMMITFSDTRSYLRATIGYQDENLVNSCAENYEKKKESCTSHGRGGECSHSCRKQAQAETLKLVILWMRLNSVTKSTWKPSL